MLAHTVVPECHTPFMGFGFIKPRGGGANIFFHVNGDGNEKIAKNLTKGRAVTYMVGKNGEFNQREMGEMALWNCLL